MQRKGVATFTLDGGKAPRWLFHRMVKLSRAMVSVIIDEYGPDEMVRRLSDPIWFQSLGTVVAFDWNASGLTTTLMGALKEAIKEREQEWGLVICGGKGNTSRQTPDHLRYWGYEMSWPAPYVQQLIYNSRLTAKVDNSLIQDGFQLYHHTFIISRSGAWTVVQQGMNTQAQRARRYHWYSEDLQDLISEPHTGISAHHALPHVLNLSDDKSEPNRRLSVEMLEAGYPGLQKDLKLLRKYSTPISSMATVQKRSQQLTLLDLKDTEFDYHPVVNENFVKSKYLDKIFARLSVDTPRTYEELVATPGVGPKSIRALSLIGEVIYGASPSYKDPARYSFAHGGKDGTPYPVDTQRYDRHIEILQKAVRKAQLSLKTKDQMLRRLEG